MHQKWHRAHGLGSRAAALAATVALTACAAEAPSPVSAPPQVLSLQHSDLPPGFLVDPQLNHALSVTSVATDAQDLQLLRASGWSGGYRSGFVRDPGRPSQQAVTSAVVLYQGERGAQAVFAAESRAVAGASGAAAAVAELGSDSVFTSADRTRGPVTVHTFTFLWRDRNVVVNLLVTDASPAIDVTAARAIATLQEARIRSR